jgi:hypothetical protein
MSQAVKNVKKNLNDGNRFDLFAVYIGRKKQEEGRDAPWRIRGL